MKGCNERTSIRYKDKKTFDNEVKPFLQAQRDYDLQQITQPEQKE
jgi:hypothetical protein